MRNVVNVQSASDLHPVRPFNEHIDDQFLVGRLPSLHIRIRVYDRFDIVVDIFQLSSLVVKGYGTETQGFEDGHDVDLGSTGDAYPQIRRL